MAKVDLSNAFISAIEPPVAGSLRKTYTSAFLRGLSLVVKLRNGVDIGRIVETDDVSKYCSFVWRMRYVKANGSRTTLDLGYWPAMNQDSAAIAGREVLLAVAEGRDLVKERMVERELVVPDVNVAQVKTVSYVLRRFIEYRENRYPDKQSTTEFYKKQINNHILSRWGLFSVDAITQWTWQEYIRDVKQAYSDNVARHVHSTMRAALSFAVQSEEFPFVKSNMLLGLKVVSELKVTVRERFFDHEELHVWMNELMTRDATVTQKNILMLQVYQGLRISEILDIQLSSLKTLSKSEIKVVVKGGKDGHTMLSTQAIHLIKTQMRHLIGSEIKSAWLFPHDRDLSRNYTAREVGDFVKNIRRGWVDFSSHDLRRTCRTWLGEFACPKEMRDKICNHAVPTGKDASYDHSKRKDEQLRWMQLWADKLDLIKADSTAFRMEADTSIDAESASELDDLMKQLL